MLTQTAESARPDEFKIIAGTHLKVHQQARGDSPTNKQQGFGLNFPRLSGREMRSLRQPD